ncbi:sigma-70 family RNA polymerase sigma factor [Clostridium butyricum]|uniref:RNA polymerase sigma-70 region 4 domain-containing protein n=1 Tax=Clostridium butyricum TaxID=1492 RepID=A0AAP9RHV1_CLOBU|nr:hypothetical protein [Clostridium butyricum]MBZ5746838.1 hypothetical protein [Clostridium butyricum]MDI9207911.1 hypothetical protein [Clostridium butyricum]QMW91896.1 hypothetical protein FF104_13210 [Clostridium butyricum]BBK75880.1 hypothetical protein Cbu04g_08880 [Clostridium butyricum]GEQ27727.1 hypothetical protein CBU03nite_41500 [Clostridium butyricum]
MFLYKKEIINRTKELLKNAPNLKEKSQKNKLTLLEHYEINSLIRALNALQLEDQKLIAYKYFENKTKKQIAEIMFISVKIVGRKIDEIILKIGHIIYGIEKEVWNLIE